MEEVRALSSSVPYSVDLPVNICFLSVHESLPGAAEETLFSGPFFCLDPAQVVGTVKTSCQITLLPTSSSLILELPGCNPHPSANFIHPSPAVLCPNELEREAFRLGGEVYLHLQLHAQSASFATCSNLSGLDDTRVAFPNSSPTGNVLGR